MSENEILENVVSRVENMIISALEQASEYAEKAKRNYQRSDSIVNLSMALLKAQGQFDKAKINTKGYGYNYANLESVIDACRPALVDNELALIQLPSNDGSQIILTTLLVHSSGEFISSEISAIAEKTMSNQGKVKTTEIQARGSIITYLRRYSMSAMLGISTGDDNDGADIDEQPKQQQRQQKQSKPSNVAKSTPKQQKQQTPREWLASQKSLTYAIVQTALLKTGKFENSNFAMDMIESFFVNNPVVVYKDSVPQQDENGNDILFVPSKNDKVRQESALRVFDWCINTGKEGE